MNAISRQVRRAAERHTAKAEAAIERIEARIAIRRDRKMQPLDRDIVRNPYPASTHRPFEATGKDWRAIAAEKERAKQAGVVRKAAGKVKAAVIGTLAAAAMAR